LVVFFGDSRASNWSTPADKQYEFLNRGIGAQTTIQVLERFDAHVKPLMPKVIVIQVGINDLKTIPLFPEDRETIVINCERNIQRIVDKSLDLGATVILTTIFPIGDVPIERRPFWSNEVEKSIDEVNTYIRSLAKDKVIILDAYSVLLGEKGRIQPEYSYDLLHLTDAGYLRLNEELVPLLQDVK
ncbi:MAG: SGNH/GDSL hydrolase family protein, partial [Anaerolineae bacterium]|nr:SGNH/GDSL hydrolase family protein [Anaerolineae bacterium]